jgi:hypothetical protein
LKILALAGIFLFMGTKFCVEKTKEFYYRLNGQSTEQEAHFPPFSVFLPFSPHEHWLLPIRRARMARTTIARTTNSTMTEARFMR